jgi:tetratricopeptide (TPR) repeat protein
MRFGFDDKCRARAWLVAAAIGMLVTVGVHPARADELDTGCGGLALQQVKRSLHEMHEGHASGALAYANEALAAYPHCMSAYFALGQAHLDSADNDAAVADFTHVVNAHPDYPLPYFDRGLAYLHGRHPLEAVADFDRAVQTNVGMGKFNSVSMLMRRSIALEMLGRNNLALVAFTTAMNNIDSTTGDYDVLDEHCFSATVVDLLDMAQLSCDESISRHSRNIRIYNARGYLDLKRSNWDLAIADYTQALYYRPDFSQSLYGRAIARQAKGDSAGAMADMKQAVAAEPGIAAIMARYGIQPKT